MNTQEIDYRSYNRSDCIFFWKIEEKFGELSNMINGFPLSINEIVIASSEALYQACKFPHVPNLQKEIITQQTPFLSKRVCKPFDSQVRDDWFEIRESVMNWCLQIKLLQNWSRFSEVLLSTGDKVIVEYSEKDDFWGAMPKNPEIAYGKNILGLLLTDLREELKIKSQISDWSIPPHPVENFHLLGEEISVTL